ncbi:hypothetical protein MKW92_032630 [Papaver armeniacum]|nr:hypothetical protein MKW92_032630 [Papaver armeniacum]
MTYKGIEDATEICSGELSHQVGIVCDILSRLPVKTLMRFKCVSKHWHYIIQDNKYFADLFHTRSKLRPCLFIAVPLPWKLAECLRGSFYIICREYKANLLTADLKSGKIEIEAADGAPAPVIQNINNMMSVNYDSILKPVNGIICFTDTSWNFGVRIYNLATRELTPWLETTLKIVEDDRSYHKPCYQFGFDPATKEHKIICLWKNINSYLRRDSQRAYYVACEVLTVGNNAWRTIDEIPQYDLEDGAYSLRSLSYANGGSVYVNGSVYWISKFRHCSSEQKVIVAFDVGSEKFRTIALPKFITDQLLVYDKDWYFNPPINLFEVNDRVGVLRRFRVGYTVKLWILDDKKDTNTGGITCNNQIWSEVMNIDLPFQLDEKKHIEFHGVPGTDDILIETYEDATKLRCLSLLYFNWKNKTFRKVESNELCSSILHSEKASEERHVALVSTFTESLFPVNKKSS